MKTEIYVLTYNKKIKQNYDSDIYKPIVCGANSVENTYGYICDNTGDNISDLNEYYTELTGEYWAWKNSDADIIGFCHYRRWYVKNLKLDKLTKKDILDDLKKYDIILPHNFLFNKTVYEFQKEVNYRHPKYDVEYDDYVKIGKILDKYYPDYGEVYKKVMNGNKLYFNNMFICKRELANEYFEWVFDALEKIMEELDLTKYESRDKRIVGFISERLLTTFIVKNKLNAKEYFIYNDESLIPHMFFIRCGLPKLYFILQNAYYLFLDTKKLIKHKI